MQICMKSHENEGKKTNPLQLYKVTGNIVTTSILYKKSIKKRIVPKIGSAKKFKSPSILYIKRLKFIRSKKINKAAKIRLQSFTFRMI